MQRMASESRRSQMLRGVLDLCLLAVVVDEPAYGYEMTRRLRERGLSTVGEGLDLPPARPARARRPRRDAPRGERRRAAAQVLPHLPERPRALAEGLHAWRDVRGEVDSVLAAIEAEVA